MQTKGYFQFFGLVDFFPNKVYVLCNFGDGILETNYHSNYSKIARIIRDN